MNKEKRERRRINRLNQLATVEGSSHLTGAQFLHALISRRVGSLQVGEGKEALFV